MAKPHLFQPLLAKQARAHRLVNCTRAFVLAAVIEPAFESLSRRTGLLGRQTLPFDTVLAIAPSNAIHTFGMQFPLDVLFINRSGMVVKRSLALKARRLAVASRAFAVLEFAAGHPGVEATRIGDQLGVEETDLLTRDLPTPRRHC
jgi:uncharacterized membrane protein (UPF0127 family)